ncbi:MAG TPA: type II secretion system F family protein [Candidatus Sulfopaludibacter sp.]|jgi:tight adherence protein B|nr:type II secretion system F family protein [Candidatus Sulfopaludibacter sp.]
MPVGVIVAFVVVFALILLAVSVALKFFDARRKQQVTGMLQTASGETVVTVTNLLKEIDIDKPGGLKGIIKTFQFSKHAQEQIQQAGMSWSSTRLLAAMGLAMVPGLGLGALVPFIMNGPTTALICALGFGTLPYLFVRHKRKKRLDQLEEQFPEALDFLARSMRAGHAFSISLEMIGEELADPLGQEFRALFNEQNLGAPLEIALRNFTDRVPLLDVRFFTSSVQLQRQTGGNLSEILARLAYVIRERFRLKGQVKAASAHGRLTATILTLLPVATMLGLLVVAPGYLQTMAEDSDGKYMIGGAIFAQILGNFFIKKIINIKV